MGGAHLKLLMMHTQERAHLVYRPLQTHKDPADDI